MGIVEVLVRLRESCWLAQRYAYLYSLSDGELAARNLVRDDLGRRYLADLDAIEAHEAATSRQVAPYDLPA